MDILLAFKEPTVISSIFLGLLYYLFPDFGKKIGEGLISYISHFSRRISKIVRMRIWCKKKRTLQIIYNPYEMQWLITRTFSFMILFFASFVSFIILISSSSVLTEFNQLSKPVQFLASSPVFIFEILWLTQWLNTKHLIKVSLKRVTSQKTHASLGGGTRSSLFLKR